MTHTTRNRIPSVPDHPDAPRPHNHGPLRRGLRGPGGGHAPLHPAGPLPAGNGPWKRRFCNSVTQFLGPASSDERIHLEFFVERGTLVTSIRERASPSTGARRNATLRTAWSTWTAPAWACCSCIRAWTRWNSSCTVGRARRRGSANGCDTGRCPTNCWRCGPPAGVIASRSPPPRSACPPRRNCLRAPSGVRCYGYTQEALLYDLEALTAKIPQRRIRARRGRGPGLGRADRAYRPEITTTPACGVPEMGLAFLDPHLPLPRRHGQAVALLLDQSRQRGDRGILRLLGHHAHALAAGHGAILRCHPCGLLMGIAASGMQVKELATSRQERARWSTLHRVRPLAPHRVTRPAHTGHDRGNIRLARPAARQRRCRRSGA